MLRYIVKRLLQGILVIIGVSILIFILARVVPGDPARMSLGPNAPQFAVDNLKKEMHLDKPIVYQYYYWFTGFIRGDLGNSVSTKRPVIMDIKDFFPASLELVLFSAILMMVFSITLGLMAARYSDTWVDNTLRVSAYFGISFPHFVVGVLLILFFGFLWPILPVIGRLGSEIIPPKRVTGLLVVDSLIDGNFPALFDSIKRLVVPSVALTLGPIVQQTRIFRSSLKDNLDKEYIVTATSYGLPRGLIFRKYLFKPSFIVLVSIMGLSIANLMGVAFIIESIFNWPGLARYGMNAMLTKDLNAISGVVLIAAFMFIIINIIVDIIIAKLDPRIRLGGD